jgi:hypothetical protein
MVFNLLIKNGHFTYYLDTPLKAFTSLDQDAPPAEILSVVGKESI